MIFNLNLILIYFIFILTIFILSYTDKYCKEKVCSTILLLIILHIFINYIYNENFTSESIKPEDENKFYLNKDEVLYIIGVFKKSINDDNLKVVINSSLHNINLLYSKLAKNIGKVIYISSLYINDIENMVNTNYNSFLDLIKSIDNMQLPEKIIDTKSNNIFINNNDNIFSKIILSYNNEGENNKYKSINNTNNLLPYTLNLPSNINTVSNDTINTKNTMSNDTINIKNTMGNETIDTKNTMSNETIDTKNIMSNETIDTKNIMSNETNNNNEEILKNLNLLKNQNLDNYNNDEIKYIVSKAMNDNNENFKKILDNTSNNNNLKYNQINDNLMKPLGKNSENLSNKWNNNDYTLLNTDKWTLQDSTPYKCKQICDICPSSDSKFASLKNFDDRVLNPDNINIDYIKDRLNQ